MTDSQDLAYPPRDTTSFQLTVRAVLTGMVLGGILSLCNIYVSLQIGWSTNMSVAGVLLAFAIWKVMGLVFQAMRPFSVLENNISQTACSAGAAVSSAGLVAPIPALALMTDRELPWPQLSLWVFSVCLVGITSAIVIRRQMIEVDRLPFPGGLASAQTLKEVYSTGADAIQRVLMLVFGAVTAAAVKVLAIVKVIPAYLFPGRIGGHSASSLGFELEPSLLMVGVGALIGTRGAWSMLFGAVLAWGVLAPWALNRGFIELKSRETLVALPEGVALPDHGRLQHKANRDLLEWRGLMSDEERDGYLAMSDDVAWQSAIVRLWIESDLTRARLGDASGDGDSESSPVAGGEWTSVIELGEGHALTVPPALDGRFTVVGDRLVVRGPARPADVDELRSSYVGRTVPEAAAAALASLPVRTRIEPVSANFTDILEWLLWPGVTLMVVSSLVSFALCGKSIVRAFRGSGGGPSNDSGDVPLKWFMPLACVTLLLSVVAQTYFFDIPWWAAALAVVLSVVLAVVAARVSGETNITPIGAMGKVTQLTFGALLHAQPAANLMTANVTGGAASQAADLMHDMKTGAMLGATPWKQVIAQIFGACAGALAGSAIYLTLIHDPHRQLFTPEWPAPAVATWKAVAELFQRGFEALPAGAPMAMLVAGIAGIVLPIVDRFAPRKVKPFIPSASSVGLSFVVAAKNAISIFLGGMLALLIGKFAKTWTSKFLVTLAAGLIVGDALVGAGSAVITVIRGLMQ